MGLLHMQMCEAGHITHGPFLDYILASSPFKEKLRKNSSSLKGERTVRICILCFGR